MTFTLIALPEDQRDPALSTLARGGHRGDGASRPTDDQISRAVTLPAVTPDLTTPPPTPPSRSS
ncbi:hypothetical protein ACN3XK_52510 [Actinomadura welshii]